MTKIKNFLPYYLYFVLFIPWMLVIAPLSFKGREVIRVAALRMGFDRRFFGLLDERDYPIDSVDADALHGVDFNFDLLHPNSHDGSVSTYELIILNKLVRSQDPKLIVEFGTFDGRTALNFAVNAPQAEIVTIDFEPQPCLFEGTPYARNIRREAGDSTKFDETPYRAKVDFIFVDGGHDAPVVTSDTLKALDMVAPDGVVVWHDYRYFTGVQEAISEGIRRRGRDSFRFIRDTTMVIFRPGGFG